MGGVRCFGVDPPPPIPPPWWGPAPRRPALGCPVCPAPRALGCPVGGAGCPHARPSLSRPGDRDDTSPADTTTPPRPSDRPISPPGSRGSEVPRQEGTPAPKSPVWIWGAARAGSPRDGASPGPGEGCQPWGGPIQWRFSGGPTYLSSAGGQGAGRWVLPRVPPHPCRKINTSTPRVGLISSRHIAQCWGRAAGLWYRRASTIPWDAAAVGKLRQGCVSQVQGGE